MLSAYCPRFHVKWTVNTRSSGRCPSRSLIPVLTEFGTARSLSPQGDLLIPVDDLIDDHSTVDTTPGMNLRGRTSLYDDTIIIDCEPIASLAIHYSPPDRVPSSTRGTVCGIPGAAA